MSENLCSNQTVSIQAWDTPGMLERICNLLNRRGFAVRSISAGKSKERSKLALTVVVCCDAPGQAQVQQQLAKVNGVVRVELLRPDDKVEREMALIKIKPKQEFKCGLLQLLARFKGRVVEASSSGYVLEITGAEEKIDLFLDRIASSAVEEIVRTSPVALSGCSKSRMEAMKKEVRHGADLL